jgi:predicted restriction endonuclease
MCKLCRKTYDINHSKESIRDLLLAHGTNYTTKIRMQSRYRMKNAKQFCAVCGYANHVHVAHIKPVASFPLETPVTEVNGLDNLVLLCPNHHWEFDHGLLNLDFLVAPVGLEPT